MCVCTASHSDTHTTLSSIFHAYGGTNAQTLGNICIAHSFCRMERGSGKAVGITKVTFDPLIHGHHYSPRFLSEDQQLRISRRVQRSVKERFYIPRDTEWNYRFPYVKKEEEACTVLNQCLVETTDNKTSAWLSASFVEGGHCVCLIPLHSLDDGGGFSQDQVCKEGSRRKAQAAFQQIRNELNLVINVFGIIFYFFFKSSVPQICLLLFTENSNLCKQNLNFLLLTSNKIQKQIVHVIQAKPALYSSVSSFTLLCTLHRRQNRKSLNKTSEMQMKKKKKRKKQEVVCYPFPPSHLYIFKLHYLSINVK